MAGPVCQSAWFAGFCDCDNVLGKTSDRLGNIDGFINDGGHAARCHTWTNSRNLVDNYSRKRIIIYSDLLRGVLVILLSFALLYYSEATRMGVVLLFVIAVLFGVIGSMFNPAIMASIPDIVPDKKIDAANSLSRTTRQISLFIGQALGGYLFVLFGAPQLILINGLSYLFSAFSESFITIPQDIPEKAKGIE